MDCMQTSRRSVWLGLGLAAVGIAGSAASAEIVYGVTDRGFLVSWEATNPGAVLTGVAISGLASNETVQGIDRRPDTGELYAVGSFSRLYSVDPATGVATMVGGGPFSPGLSGSSFGFDFNPTIDRIRNVSDANQNLVLNPNDGTSTAVTSLFYGVGDSNEGADPNVVGSAYTNSYKGAMETQLYGLDSGLDILVKQANSAGTLTTVGSIGTDITDLVGFDISGTSGIAYAVVGDTNLSRSTFWTIDLTTGTGTMVGEVGGGAVITAMTVVPAPSALGVAWGALALAAFRRRR
ncbi:MAG: DUF4394 domain-containing protein [Phycisphaerales bacterium]|nr:DUF4394 domain-containing protein [Phycisphaerales bacterium]